MTDFVWAERAVVVPFGARGIIDGANKPIKSLGVDLLGEGIGRVSSLDHIERDSEPFVPRHNGPLQQRLFDIVGVHPHQTRQLRQLLVAGNDGTLLVLGAHVKDEVAKLQHRADRPHELAQFVIPDTDDGQRLHRLRPPLRVGAALNDGRFGPAHVGKGLVVRPHQPIPYLRLLRVGRRQQLVEDVVRPLLGLVSHDAALLQQVHLAPAPRQHGRRHRPTGVRRVGGILGVELQLDELAEARRVVVADGPGVAERLEERVGIQDAVDDGGCSEGRWLPIQLRLFAPSSSPATATTSDSSSRCLLTSVFVVVGMESGIDPARRLEAGQLGHEDLDRLGLAGAALPADQDGLVQPVDAHVVVGQAAGLVHVRLHQGLGVDVAVRLRVVPPGPHQRVGVPSHPLRGVQPADPLVRIDGDDDVAGPRVGRRGDVAGLEVVQDGRLVEEGQVDHVGNHPEGSVLVDVLEGQDAAVVVGQVDRDLLRFAWTVPVGLDVILVGVLPDRYRDGAAAAAAAVAVGRMVRDELGGQPAVLFGFDVHPVGGLVGVGGNTRRCRRRCHGQNDTNCRRLQAT